MTDNDEEDGVLAKIKRPGDKLFQECEKLKLKVEKFSINTAARGRGVGFRSVQSTSHPDLSFSLNHFLETRYCVLFIEKCVSDITHIVASFALQIKLLPGKCVYILRPISSMCYVYFPKSIAWCKFCALFPNYLWINFDPKNIAIW